MDNETTPPTPSVSPIDEDAERREVIDAIESAYYGPSAHPNRGLTHDEIVLRIAGVVQQMLDSRDAALREARSQFKYFQDIASKHRDELEAALCEARDTLEALTRAARAALDHPELDSARATLRGFVQIAERKLSRSQPATPSPDPLSCPIHHSFIVELDGSRRCNFDGCNWSVTPSPVPTKTMQERFNDGDMPMPDIGSSVMTDTSGRQQPSPERARWPRQGDQMRFLGKNGFEGELERACDTFVVGDIYEVEKCEVGNWSHSVYFVGILSGWNGVMFELIPATVVSRQDTADVTDEPKQHSTVRSDDHEAGQPSPEDGLRVEDRERAQWLWDHLPLRQPESKQEWLSKAELAICAARQSGHLRGERAGLERALQWVDAIHQGKDNSRDPAVVDNTCIRIRHAIRALLPPSTPET